MISPTQYFRENKFWAKYLGQKGVVIVSTTLQVSAPAQAKHTPGGYALVQLKSEKKEFLVVANQQVKIGDKVVCVLRKLADDDSKGIIHYGIKVKKL